MSQVQRYPAKELSECFYMAVPEILPAFSRYCVKLFFNLFYRSIPEIGTCHRNENQRLVSPVHSYIILSVSPCASLVNDAYASREFCSLELSVFVRLHSGAKSSCVKQVAVLGKCLGLPGLRLLDVGLPVHPDTAVHCTLAVGSEPYDNYVIVIRTEVFSFIGNSARGELQSGNCLVQSKFAAISADSIRTAGPGCSDILCTVTL